jgi:peptide/nickel transport system ATP-binding protein
VADVQDIFAKPGHPYTEALFGAIPSTGRRGRPLRVIPGQVPDLSKSLSGCRFKERCAYRIAQCDEAPALSEISPSQAAACWKRGNYRPGGDRRD